MREPTRRVEIDAGPEALEAVAARLWEAGALGLWERADGIVGWFPEPVELHRVTDEPDLERVIAGARWSIEPDRDWQEEWKATIRPVQAGRTMIVPSWLTDDHAADPDALTVVLDPGRAFGSGHHATTTLCLELLDALDVEGRLAGRTLADIGCGSGILAIAAALRGARVEALDIDENAVTATRQNAARNDADVHVVHGSVQDLDHPVEIVVANLITDVIAQLAGPLVAASTDLVVASGITAERSAIAVDALAAAGLHIDTIRERDGWIALIGHVGRVGHVGEVGHVGHDHRGPAPDA